MEKITKKNSILYNQLWILNAIEDGNINYIPVKNKYSNYSIGEVIEARYKLEEEHEFRKNSYNINEKITKKNSLLYTREWILKAIEDKKTYLIPCNRVNNFSKGEIIALRYFEEEIINANKHNILLLKKEKTRK